MDLKDNNDEIIKLFQEIYSGERESVFSKRIQTVLDMRNSQGPIPRNQRILCRPELEDLFKRIKYDDCINRDRIICNAYKLFAYTQSEIAHYLRMDSTTISKIVSKTN